MDHHQSENIFATCGQQVDIWKEDRSEPVRSFTWGVDSTHHVKFNPIEVSDYDETFLVLYVLITVCLLTWLGKKSHGYGMSKSNSTFIITLFLC